jgi:predicted transcriptional regulator
LIVFLSIHPQHAEAILGGRKRFEFRRVPPRDATKLILYATSPVQRIVGYAHVAGILAGSPEALWKKCATAAGIHRDYFMAYFAGREQAFAIEVKDPIRLIHPVEVGFLGNFAVPQSYRYLDGARFGRVLARGNRRAA